MLALLSSGIFGSLLGGVFRLIPEVLKFWDQKNVRSHELNMFKERLTFEKMQGDQKLAEIGANRDAANDSGVLNALVESIKQQGEMAKAAGGWAASLSASVRPLMTYYLLFMYGLVKVCIIWSSISGGTDWAAAIVQYWTNDDMTLLCGVVNYWVLDRTLRGRGL